LYFLSENLTQKVVHVHALAPPLLVSDLVLVLEVADDLRPARQYPDQPSTVRGRVSNRMRDLHVPAAVPFLALLVNLGYQVANELKEVRTL
jgi:hypothetical protein